MRYLKAFGLAIAFLFFTNASAEATTYTVEPFDYDGVVSWWNPTLTQEQFGGSQCPCEKVPYIADGLHNQQGADKIWDLVQNGTIKSGDTVMGFSDGAQVISLYMSQHPLPAGVKVLLAGDTLVRNQVLVDQGQGIPLDTPNQVTMVAREYDGWSDFPDKTAAPGYWSAFGNAVDGALTIHNYVNAKPGDPANVVTHENNITAELVPTQSMPNGNDSDRLGIDDAYSRPAPTQDQLDNAGPEQVTTTPPMAAEADAQ